VNLSREEVKKIAKEICMEILILQKEENDAIFRENVVNFGVLGKAFSQVRGGILQFQPY